MFGNNSFKKYFVFLFFMISLQSISCQESVEFNRLSLIIPDHWQYSSNPNAPEGVDQLQLFSNDTKRTLLITLTDFRNDIEPAQLYRMVALNDLQKASSIPEFQDCKVSGGSINNPIWGRNGIASMHEYQNNSAEVVLKVYTYLEIIEETNDILFISAFIIGDEKPDYVDIIESMQILGLEHLGTASN
ncbi:hypothetical protein [Sediminispirochaeta bajacaliforniensis]|uniref:hypothetical protein n=1 Tax=Sediminispirochaeta bajacaliforniensis TaxID=148 RepID=UPI0003705B02|nr:hypothetical protein [Sediminispirochaeta bajacaliforniensis]